MGWYCWQNSGKGIAGKAVTKSAPTVRRGAHYWNARCESTAVLRMKVALMHQMTAILH